MKKVHGETVESNAYESNNFISANEENQELSTTINHIVPHSMLSPEDKKNVIFENELIGNSDENNKISAHIDPHIVKNDNNEYQLSQKTVDSINKYNKNGSKFLVKNIQVKDENGNMKTIHHLMTSHTIEGKNSFRIPISGLRKENQDMINKTGYDVYEKDD
jgi:hypothetical protein